MSDEFVVVVAAAAAVGGGTILLNIFAATDGNILNYIKILTFATKN